MMKNSKKKGILIAVAVAVIVVIAVAAVCLNRKTECRSCQRRPDRVG